ncbi:homeodomain-interacting protein kinase 2-like isoform X1 [Cynoglossus semilaevis]|uniref:homeodomain-interacting protein kinase 2-like isoform X1 n=1 Tax=Cynoglossus semilaevis TaxID=244447 RepID=UPI0004955308|nr:homeodomain-interacting protein kinase 2-like isoform X1 [Cynoglossus semilaevis]
MGIRLMKRREREPNYKLIYTLNGYSPVNPLGTGAFGKVYKCVSVETKETVALKSVKKWTGEKEVAMLEKLRTLDKDNSNLIKFNKHFEFAGFLTLEFEMLDMDLHQFVKSFTRPLQLPEIQAITQQMLVALDALKSVRVVHTDIKPDNIMLINHQQLPFKVKLIDFGLAHTISEMHTGTKHQATLYRAPEVLLGLPLHEGLDMWSLGCVAAYLYLGQHLYPSRCEHERMRDTVQIHGQPGDHLLNSGVHTKHYFSKEDECPRPLWKINQTCKCPKELPKERRNAAYQRKFLFNTLGSLDDIVRSCPDHTGNEKAFVNLLKEMMEVDASERITPCKALEHPFITSARSSSQTSSSTARSSVSLVKPECEHEKAPIKTKTPLLRKICTFFRFKKTECLGSLGADLINPT